MGKIQKNVLRERYATVLQDAQTESLKPGAL
jgi:hypothetical protein